MAVALRVVEIKIPGLEAIQRHGLRLAEPPQCCVYSTLNHQGTDVLGGQCVDCDRTDYENCASAQAQEGMR